jgi:hypothetical protein
LSPWTLFTPKRVKAYRKLRTARVRAGRFFDVTCERGHVFEMTGAALCYRLDGLGEHMQCPECLAWVKVASIVEGLAMNEEQREQQEKDYEAWKAFTIRNTPTY